MVHRLRKLFLEFLTIRVNSVPSSYRYLTVNVVRISVNGGHQLGEGEGPAPQLRPHTPLPSPHSFFIFSQTPQTKASPSGHRQVTPK
ncbi:hypothetical protein VNO78_20657 [Psophocarpus tetragonolobus]|uniref:Uncharacterized protein n=1 Tax=Psophocarpus tetragonolobus TaxID=3891 RepID=A0AAN9XGY5_PSOTE